jgi:glyoxylase-like metal-dependent hydrolase (beta-lactamase superfamily II)
MLLQQFYLGCLAHASYLIADESSRLAAVIDPQRDIGRYLAFAAVHDLQIRYAILTHFHADFLAGHLELRDRTGAEICLGRAASAEYASCPWATAIGSRLAAPWRSRRWKHPGTRRNRFPCSSTTSPGAAVPLMPC